MTYENSTYKVTVNGNRVEIIKKAFGDRYVVTMEGGRIKAQSSIGLAQAMRARRQLGF